MFLCFGDDFVTHNLNVGKERLGHILIFQQTLIMGPPGVLGIWGEGLFIFRELGSTANYFRGAGEQAHTFGDLGSIAKK